MLAGCSCIVFFFLINTVKLGLCLEINVKILNFKNNLLVKLITKKNVAVYKQDRSVQNFNFVKQLI